MICKEPLLNDISIDHIYPKSRGGSNEIDNLQLAHCKCNSQKSDTIYPHVSSKASIHSELLHGKIRL